MYMFITIVPAAARHYLSGKIRKLLQILILKINTYFLSKFLLKVSISPVL